MKFDYITYCQHPVFLLSDYSDFGVVLCSSHIYFPELILQCFFYFILFFKYYIGLPNKHQLHCHSNTDNNYDR